MFGPCLTIETRQVRQLQNSSAMAFPSRKTSHCVPILSFRTSDARCSDLSGHASGRALDKDGRISGMDKGVDQPVSVTMQEIAK